MAEIGVLRLSRRATPQKAKLTEFHIMRIGATLIWVGAAELVTKLVTNRQCSSTAQ